MINSSSLLFCCTLSLPTTARSIRSALDQPSALPFLGSKPFYSVAFSGAVVLKDVAEIRIELFDFFFLQNC